MHAAFVTERPGIRTRIIRRNRHRRGDGDRAERTRIEERLRVARELHDVIAHTMSVITVQAGVGAYVAAARIAAIRTVAVGDGLTQKALPRGTNGPFATQGSGTIMVYEPVEGVCRPGLPS